MIALVALIVSGAALALAGFAAALAVRVDQTRSDIEARIGAMSDEGEP